jgi:predicted ribosome quality control (RQC) complex YloA/Tae2 family protein
MGIRQFKNERSFALQLADGFSILFKMHGNRSNVVIFENNAVSDVFKNSLEADTVLQVDSLDREIDWSFETFQKNHVNLQPLYFTFGKPVWRYLEESGFNDMSVDEKWVAVQRVRHTLENPRYYISALDHTIRLMLLQTGKIIKTLDDPLIAGNEFYYTYSQSAALLQEKNALLSSLRTRLAGSKSFYTKNQVKLSELSHDTNFKEWADLIMANLHLIKPHTEKITVPNFYNNDLPVEIKLKKLLSPQKNAEVYYRKAKNQQIEIDRLQQAILAKEQEIQSLEKQLIEVEATSDLKTVRRLTAETASDEGPKKQNLSLPYHEFLANGFTIWVGKNAQANDILTQKYSYKEDLWLHAKDVAGSHVLIKHQAGKNFPKEVIERAAQLAAYNSKRKHDTLCPVVVTPKKFVRKRKGDPAGAVVVEREEVILVEPKLS